MCYAYRYSRERAQALSNLASGAARVAGRAERGRRGAAGGSEPAPAQIRWQLHTANSPWRRDPSLIIVRVRVARKPQAMPHR